MSVSSRGYRSFDPVETLQPLLVHEPLEISCRINFVVANSCPGSVRQFMGKMDYFICRQENDRVELQGKSPAFFSRFASLRVGLLSWRRASTVRPRDFPVTKAW